MSVTDERKAIAEAVCPGFPLDLGIARAVEVLQGVEGVTTFESCEGGEEHSYAEPTVRFYGSPGAGWSALAACMEHGLPVMDLSRTWNIDSGEPSGPFWELTFRCRID